MQKTLIEWTQEYRNRGKAIAHFNACTLDMIQGLVDALDKFSTEVGERVPMVIGFAEKERDWLGESMALQIIRHHASERQLPIFCNGDHTYSFERAKTVIDAGYDAVVVDGAELPYDQNVAMVRQAVEYRNNIGSSCVIEAELGYIGSGSSIKESLPDGVSEATMAKPDEALRFITETGCDMLAPAVGNVHGMVKSGMPHLHPGRVSEIVAVLPHTPLVLHGGSGSTDDDFRAVINAGISTIHISTELRLAYTTALRASLTANGDEITPYKYLVNSKQSVHDVAYNRIKLFWGM